MKKSWPATLGLLLLLAFVAPSRAANPPAGLYSLQSVNDTALCMDTTASGAVVQAACTGSATQEWTLTASGSNYQLINNASGDCLDVVNYSTANGALIDQWACGGATHLNQIWTLKAQTGGAFSLISANSQKCLDVPNLSKTPGQQLDQWTCINGQANQSWTFIAEGGAQPVNGTCGSANGVAVSSAPTSNLCSSGTATAVSGSGPWTWSCTGSNGGTTASCSAPVQAAGGGSNIPAGWPTTFVLGNGVWSPSTQYPYLAAATSQGPAFKLGATDEYLSGGINSGWQTYGASFVPTAVSDAKAQGMLPVFVYYMIVGSPPQPNDGSPQTDLNTASTMAAYYADWKALMQKLAGLGPVGIVFEPDTLGYMQPAGAGQTVSVASSGFAEAASFPNTLAGFGALILHLRDTYASNVFVGPVVDSWDWNSNSNCSFDVTTSGKNDAAYYTAVAGNVGGHQYKWDMLFNDPGYGDWGASRGVYWDPNDVTCPNFNELNTWTQALTTASGLRLSLWQTPLGNSTLPNTAYHYKDTRIEYYLKGYPGDGHLAAFANAGGIGIFFPGGEPSPTVAYPESGLSGDADGGLLRTLSNMYYAAPLTLH